MFGLFYTHLVSCEAEYDAGVLAGPVDHQVQVAVVEVEGGAHRLVLDEPGLALHPARVPPRPRPDPGILGVSEDVLDPLLLVHMTTGQTVSMV